LKLAVAAERDMMGKVVMKERVRVGRKDWVRVGIMNVGKWRGRTGEADLRGFSFLLLMTYLMKLLKETGAH
jgi:hypothetical protein